MRRLSDKTKRLLRRRPRTEPGQGTVTAEMVSHAGWLRGVGDFRLFGEAYERWHGTRPSEELIEEFFSAYLKNNEIPFWVRDYVREILKDDTVAAAERRRRTIGLITFYVPLAIVFVLIMFFVYLTRG